MHDFTETETEWDLCRTVWLYWVSYNGANCCYSGAVTVLTCCLGSFSWFWSSSLQLLFPRIHIWISKLRRTIKAISGNLNSRNWEKMRFRRTSVLFTELNETVLNQPSVQLQVQMINMRGDYQVKLVSWFVLQQTATSHPSPSSSA